MLKFISLLLLLSHFLVAEERGGEEKKVGSGQLKWASIFADDMVIQRETEINVWGTGKPDQSIKVKGSWREDSVETLIDANGKWKLKLKTPSAGGPFSISAESGGELIKLNNVLSGEVWLCSGQSNMQWKMNAFGNDYFAADVAKADLPQIRYCTVKNVLALSEMTEVSMHWKVCNPQSVLKFSSVAYFFGSRLHHELNVPIGLVDASWGGSSAEAWMSESVLTEDFPIFKGVLSKHTAQKEIGGNQYTMTSQSKPKWLNHRSPSLIYNGMLKPLIPYTIAGVIWYQGESNVVRYEQYRTLFPRMIKNWRDDWAQGEFPFYFVQIAPFKYKGSPGLAAYLREAQLMALSVPNTGMAITMDVGEEHDIHPKEKKPVGERLALLALKRQYNKEVTVDSGPIYQSHEVDSDTGEVTISFDYTGSGLVTRDGNPLSHFQIAGEDRVFFPAKAIIKSGKIIVANKNVPSPKSVRFGWGNADKPNLMNKEGLPASSFRTDSWDNKQSFIEKARGGYQHDADIFRLRHMKYFGALIEEYYKKTGKYPLQGLSKAQHYVFIAAPHQERYVQDVPAQFAVTGLEEFRSVLEKGLERKVEFKFDPQKVPVEAPNFYLYMINGESFFFAVHLYKARSFTNSIGKNYHKLEITNEEPNRRGLWNYEQLIDDKGFKSAINEKPNKETFFLNLEEKYK